MKDALRLVMLRALPRLFPSRSRDNVRSSAPRIVLIRPDHLGDVIFTTPAIRLLRQTSPEAHITYIVGEWAREVMTNNPNVDEVITCPFPAFVRQPKGSLAAPYMLLREEAKKLRQYKFDAAINLRFDFWWGAMLSYFAGIPERIGYDTKECLPFLTRAVPYSYGRHEVLQNLNLVESWLNIRNDSLQELEFFPSVEDEHFAEAWLREQKTVEPIVAIHPGAGAKVKLWRSESFASLADTLVERHKATIIFTGSEKEKGLVKEIRDKMQERATDLTGVSLGQLAAVLRRCNLVIGTDSGVLHLAVAMGRPTLHLYGPVSELAFGPWGESSRHIVVKSDPQCFPCNRLDHRDEELHEHWCIKAISVEQVLSAAETLLSR